VITSDQLRLGPRFVRCAICDSSCRLREQTHRIHPTCDQCGEKSVEPRKFPLPPQPLVKIVSGRLQVGWLSKTGLDARSQATQAIVEKAWRVRDGVARDSGKVEPERAIAMTHWPWASRGQIINDQRRHTYTRLLPSANPLLALSTFPYCCTIQNNRTFLPPTQVAFA
jgi:hypothetical protein